MALLLGNGSYLLLANNGKLLLEGDPGAITHTLAPTWRTVDFGNGTGSVLWDHALDPSELKNYTIDCSAEMNGSGSRISVVDLVLTSLAVAAGLRIYGMTNDSSNITVWFNIDPAERGKPNWAPPGETHAMLCTVTSLSGEIFERRVGLPVAQLGQSA